MSAFRPYAVAGITVALLGSMAGCALSAPIAAPSNEQQPASVASNSPTLPVTQPTSSAATATASPTASPVTVPLVGSTIAADQIQAVRAAGGHVYVSPNGSGDGLVVDPAAPLPDVVVADTQAALPYVKWTDGTHTAADFNASMKAWTATGKAMQAAGIKAFVLETWPQNIMGNSLTGKTSVTIGATEPDAIAWINAHGGAPSGATAQAAISSAGARALFAAFPGTPIITYDAVVTQP